MRAGRQWGTATPGTEGQLNVSTSSRFGSGTRLSRISSREFLIDQVIGTWAHLSLPSPCVCVSHDGRDLWGWGEGAGGGGSNDIPSSPPFLRR